MYISDAVTFVHGPNIKLGGHGQIVQIDDSIFTHQGKVYNFVAIAFKVQRVIIYYCASCAMATAAENTGVDWITRISRTLKRLYTFTSSIQISSGIRTHPPFSNVETLIFSLILYICLHQSGMASLTLTRNWWHVHFNAKYLSSELFTNYDKQLLTYMKCIQCYISLYIMKITSHAQLYYWYIHACLIV